MNEESLKVLDELEKDSRTNRRLKGLLRDPEAEFADGWYMAVPSCFHDALDIKRISGASDSGWTQSRWFAFKAGDMLYDTPRGYEVWSEALKHIELAVQIETASSAGKGQNESWFPGSVTFAFLTPDRDGAEIIKRGSHTLTQTDFVRFLIAGPDQELKEKIEAAQLLSERDA